MAEQKSQEPKRSGVYEEDASGKLREQNEIKKPKQEEVQLKGDETFEQVGEKLGKFRKNFLEANQAAVATEPNADNIEEVRDLRQRTATQYQVAMEVLLGMYRKDFNL